jgi:hypothetical protein
MTTNQPSHRFRRSDNPGERAALLDHAGKINPTCWEALTRLAVEVFGQ